VALPLTRVMAAMAAAIPVMAADKDNDPVALLYRLPLPYRKKERK